VQQANANFTVRPGSSHQVSQVNLLV
jgi:hypothetical protein